MYFQLLASFQSLIVSLVPCGVVVYTGPYPGGGEGGSDKPLVDRLCVCGILIIYIAMISDLYS